MSNLSIPGERGIIEPSAISSQPIDCLKAESCKLTAYIFFWPQVLEFVGFLLLPIPFLYTLGKV